MIDLVLLANGVRTRVGIALQLDDVPVEMTTTDGVRWSLKYVDELDFLAIYVADQQP